MTKLASARKAALRVLVDAERSGTYARDALNADAGVQALDARDRGLALRLTLGVTATLGCLDEALDAFIAKPKKVAPRVRWCLRISTFELLYFHTPAEVAVSQGVELVRSCARGAVGLANAVLRRVAEGREAYLAAEGVADGDRAVVQLARAGGLPVWLVRSIIEARGLEAVRLLVASELDAAPLAVHLNARVDDLDGIGGNSCEIPGCIVDVDGPALIASGALDRADAVVSDANAQAVACRAIRNGSLLEIGAGRGTKSFVIAAESHRAGLARNHVAVELSEDKCALNRERLAAAGLDAGMRVLSGDACDLDPVLASLDLEAGERYLFDTVLVDAPCSGTGTMRRHPEIPWRLDPEDAFHGLPELQLQMLTEASRRVAPGGRLIYATCSVLPTENEGVVEMFLASEAGERFALEGSPSQTMPAPGTYDGHFCAVFLSE